MRLVQTKSELAELAEGLFKAPALFLDTEFESKRSGHRLSLLQIWDGSDVALVDALVLGDLAALRDVFADPEREWVLHAATQDIQILTRQLDIPAPKLLFDTQVVWAMLSAEYSVALNYLVYRLLGKRSGKPHQADDWLRRPLPASQLRYAAQDVEDLPALYEILRRRAAELGRQHWVHEACREVVLPVREPPAKLSLGSFRNAWQLEPDQQAALRYLIDWHNGLDASSRAEAPEAKTLLSIANRLPKSQNDLCRIKGVSQRFCRTVGPALLGKLKAAVKQSKRSDFEPITPPPYATFYEIRLDGWLQLARAEMSATLQISPELVLPQKLLRHVRQCLLDGQLGAAALQPLGSWRQELLTQTFVDFCAAHPPPAHHPKAQDGS